MEQYRLRGTARFGGAGGAALGIGSHRLGSVAAWGLLSLQAWACALDSRPLEQPCQTNAVRCNEAGLLETCSERGVWAAPIACPFVCEEDQCAGECAPNDRDCWLGTTPRRCDENGRWQLEPVCDGLCVGGRCADACTPNSAECSGSTVLVCSPDGELVPSETCEFLCDPASGTCAGECAPNALRCDERALQICNGAGLWELLVTCPYVCASAADPAAQIECGGDCAPGATRCEGPAQLATCDVEGHWSPPISCGDQPCGGVPATCAGCAESLTSCDGRCVDLDSDGEHCGRCGHDCLDMPCTDGICTPLSLAEGDFDGLAIASPWLYLLENGIARLSTAGGSRETIASAGAGDIAADARFLYVALFEPGQPNAEFWSIPNTGATSVTSSGSFLGEGPPSQQMRVNASWVFSLRLVGGGSTGFDCELTAFRKAADPPGGSRRLFRSDSPADVGAEPGTCRGLSVDDATAYTIVRPGFEVTVTEIWSVPAADGAATMLWSPESSERLEDLAVATDRVVFASSSRVGAVPTGGGASVTLTATPAYRVVVDTEFAYYLSAIDGSSTCDAGSLVRAVPLSGGEPFILANDPQPGCIEDFVLDAEAVYWLTTPQPPDTIRRLQKVATR